MGVEEPQIPIPTLVLTPACPSSRQAGSAIEMCGIVGWVDFERDLRTQKSVLGKMIDTMAPRGPDSAGQWVDRHVALGHRRLAVIDIDGGAQPMAAGRIDAPPTIITYSGEVYNYRELRADLKRRGHTFRTASDTEVVLLSYLEWGERFVTRLNGMFAFAIWDAQRQRLLLVRDRMGVKPLYYHPTPDGVIFGSEPKGILAHPNVSAVVDADGFREILAFVRTPGHAIYRGISEVPAGHLISVDRTGIQRRRYWALEADEHIDDQDTAVRTVRELLADIVERQLISDVPLCSLLSGGLDSTAVTGLAADTLAGQEHGRVRSFSVDFVGQEENFTAEPFRDSPDAPYARQAAEFLDTDHRSIMLSAAELIDPANRRRALAATDLPTASGEMFTSLYLLFQKVRRHSTVALTGEAADELFGGYKWFHDQAARNADTFPWLAVRNRIRGDEADPRHSLLDQDLLERLDIAAYQRDSYRTALNEVPRGSETNPLERRMREISYLHLTRFVRHLLDRKDRMSMAHGLEVRVPFCDHRLVQYVFNLPWSLKTFDGREKSLLRAATADLVPEFVRHRAKAPYPSTRDPAYERKLRDDLAQLLSDEVPVYPLLNVARVKELLAEPIGVRRRRPVIESVVALNDWMTLYKPSLRINS